MAAQTNGSPPDPKSVGNAFIKQYYSILHDNPQFAHRFYHDISELSRPGPDGQMNSVTTLQVRIYWKGMFFHALRTWSRCLFGSRLIIGGGWSGWNSVVICNLIGKFGSLLGYTICFTREAQFFSAQIAMSGLSFPMLNCPLYRHISFPWSSILGRVTELMTISFAY